MNRLPPAENTYHIVFEGDESLYLGTTDELPSDLRESNKRTHYISAGRSDRYKEFKWAIDSEGRITLANSLGGVDVKYLAAHRTYIQDCIGAEGTFVISTVFKGHENLWKMQRIGSLNDNRFTISLGKSKFCKDNIDQEGWVMSPAMPGYTNPDSKSQGKEVKRDKDSFYVCISKTDMN